MKSPLNYQFTEFDCGPTTILNALSFLFERNEIPPEVIRHVMLYTLDVYDKSGEAGKRGTSGMAMQFLASWLNHFSAIKKFSLLCERLVGHDVHVGLNGRLANCLQNGGAAIVKVRLGVWHYVLFTGIDDDSISLFDPYYRDRPFRDRRMKIIMDRPYDINRRVSREILEQQGKGNYAMGRSEDRECVLFFNTTRRPPPREIEYMI